NEGDIGPLESDLDSGVDLKHFVRRKQKSGLAHIDGFTGQPILSAFQPVTQRNVKFVAQSPSISRHSLVLKPGGIGLFHSFSGDGFTRRLPSAQRTCLGSYRGSS